MAPPFNAIKPHIYLFVNTLEKRKKAANGIIELAKEQCCGSPGFDKTLGKIAADDAALYHLHYVYETYEDMIGGPGPTPAVFVKSYIKPILNDLNSLIEKVEMARQEGSWLLTESVTTAPPGYLWTKGGNAVERLLELKDMYELEAKRIKGKKGQKHKKMFFMKNATWDGKQYAIKLESPLDWLVFEIYEILKPRVDSVKNAKNWTRLLAGTIHAKCDGKFFKDLASEWADRAMRKLAKVRH